MFMDSIFLLDDGGRATYLQHIMQAFGCTYICLWSYYLPQPASNCLLCLDGLYRGLANQPSSTTSSSSSSASLAQRLFDQYRQAVFNIDNNRVPGLAFKNRLPYMELKIADLQGLASIGVQMQFYQEAGIQMAVFMGCNNGEIELGMPNDSRVNLEMEIKNWFPEDFSRPSREILNIPAATDQNRPSPSSSLSVDSSEYSSLLFNMNPTTSYIPEPAVAFAPIAEHQQQQQQADLPAAPISTTLQDLSQIRRITQLPSIESEDDALTKAMIVAMTSSASSSSSTLHSQQNLLQNYQVVHQKGTAFKSYNRSSPSAAALAHSRQPPGVAAGITQKPNMFKRAITFYRGLRLTQRQEQGHAQQGSGPRSTLHMISERRRREKLNESFQVLRSLLPPGTKKDKASVLASTTEYLSSLKAQVAELSRRNQILEAQLLAFPQEKATEQEGSNSSGGSSSERVVVRISPVADASTSEARIVDMQVAVRRGQSSSGSMLSSMICILEFLKQVNNVIVMSIDGDTRMVESDSLHRISLRLRIEGGEWDESSFQEVIRRILDDMAQ